MTAKGTLLFIMQRPVSWANLRRLRVSHFQNRPCSTTPVTSVISDLSPDPVLHRSNEIPLSLWKDRAKQFLQKIKDNPELLEDKYVPLIRSKGKSKAEKVRHIVDYRRVRAIGGDGGDGNISFASVFRVERAGPDGGDGGNGGHVVFKARSGLRSLEHIPSVPRAPSGEKGNNSDCHGKNASNKVIEVPIGTVFKFKGEIVASLEEEGSIFIAARGGAGGKGNTFFTTDVDQAPKIAEFGGRGEVIQYDVELQTMADVGLIGFPNAGKSTLLRAISRARPKVASYPFTTLNPYVGMVEYADFHQLAVADIPGLIEGAHRNRGLGISFLRHIERCSCLLYVIDASLPEPWRQLEILMYELEQYQKGLSLRPNAVVANKIDLPETQENIDDLLDRVNLPIIPVSAKMGQQLLPLLSLLRLLVDHQDEQK